MNQVIKKLGSVLNKVKLLYGSASDINPPYSLRYDLCQLQKYEHVLHCNGRSLSDFETILEFGCFRGRLIKHVIEANNNASVHGCDILQAGIDYCRKNFNGTFLLNSQYPKINLSDAQFDFIYSYSVFTHLSEASHIKWLQELARLLKPNGMMLNSVKSYIAAKRMQIFSPENLGKFKIMSPIKIFEKDTPYQYVVDNPDTPEYGLTMISKDYILKNWPNYSGLKIVDYHEGCIEAYPEGCQDLVLMMKG